MIEILKNELKLCLRPLKVVLIIKIKINSMLV